MAQKQDKSIKCSDCGTEFVWTAAEQQFFEDHRLSEPKRCKPCRERKKKSRG
jgi:DNA-directed RNA polymerase subunit RPC12/RpoP